LFALQEDSVFKKIATIENRVARCLIGCVAIVYLAGAGLPAVCAHDAGGLWARGLWLASGAIGDGGVQGLQPVQIGGGGLLGAEQLLHDFGGGKITLAEGVRIFAQGGFSIAMAKAGSDGDGIHVAGQQECCVRMAQIMKPHAGETVAICEHSPLLARRIMVKWGTIPAANDGTIATPVVCPRLLCQNES